MRVGLLSKPFPPAIHRQPRAPLATRPIGSQARGNDPGLVQAMVESDQAVIETNLAIRQFQVIVTAPGETRLNEILEIIAPIPETAAQRKWKIDIIQQFVLGH